MLGLVQICAGRRQLVVVSRTHKDLRHTHADGPRYQEFIGNHFLGDIEKFTMDEGQVHMGSSVLPHHKAILFTLQQFFSQFLFLGMNSERVDNL
jgi:hypothetical protein